MNEIQLAHLMAEMNCAEQTLLNIKSHMLAGRFPEQVLDERVLRRKLTKMLETMDTRENREAA